MTSCRIFGWYRSMLGDRRCDQDASHREFTKRCDRDRIKPWENSDSSAEAMSSG